jgi:tape measure domain-containing protein
MSDFNATSSDEIASIYIEAILNTANIDKSLGELNKRKYQLNVDVDDSALYALNKHLDLKYRHLKEVNSYFSNNPITPTINTQKIDELSDYLTKLTNQTFTVKVNQQVTQEVTTKLSQNLVTDFSKIASKAVGDSVKDSLKQFKENNNPTNDTGKELKEGAKAVRNVLDSFIKDSLSFLAKPAKDLVTGFSEGISNDLGKQVSKGLQQTFAKQLGLDFKKMGEQAGNSLLEAFGVKAKKENKILTSIGRASDVAIGSFSKSVESYAIRKLNKTVASSIDSILNSVFNSAEIESTVKQSVTKRNTKTVRRKDKNESTSTVANTEQVLKNFENLSQPLNIPTKAREVAKVEANTRAIPLNFASKKQQKIDQNEGLSPFEIAARDSNKNFGYLLNEIGNFKVKGSHIGGGNQTIKRVGKEITKIKNAHQKSLTTFKNLLDSANELGDYTLVDQIYIDFVKNSEFAKTQIDSLLHEGKKVGLKKYGYDKLAATKSNITRSIGKSSGSITSKYQSIGRKAESESVSLGLNVVSGLGKGLDNKAFAKYGIDNASAYLIAIKNAFQIKSPSRVMMAIGVNIFEGLLLGIKNTMPKLNKSVLNIKNAASDLRIDKANSIQEEIKKASENFHKIFAEVVKKSGLDPKSAKTPGLSFLDIDSAGSYDVSRNQIVLPKKAKKRLASGKLSLDEIDTIVHESRHAIQSNFGKLGVKDTPHIKLLNTDNRREKADALSSVKVFKEVEQKRGNSPSREELQKLYALEVDAVTFAAKNSSTLHKNIKNILQSNVASDIQKSSNNPLDTKYAKQAHDKRITHKSIDKEAGKSSVSLGLNIASGLVVGLTQNNKQIENAASILGQLSINAIKNKLGIQSPSKVFKKIGEQVVEGFEDGLSSLNTSGLFKDILRAGDLDILDKAFTKYENKLPENYKEDFHKARNNALLSPELTTVVRDDKGIPQSLVSATHSFDEKINRSLTKIESLITAPWNVDGVKDSRKKPEVAELALVSAIRKGKELYPNYPTASAVPKGTNSFSIETYKKAGFFSLEKNLNMQGLKQEDAANLIEKKPVLPNFQLLESKFKHNIEDVFNLLIDITAKYSDINYIQAGKKPALLIKPEDSPGKAFYNYSKNSVNLSEKAYNSLEKPLNVTPHTVMAAVHEIRHALQNGFQHGFSKNPSEDAKIKFLQPGKHESFINTDAENSVKGAISRIPSEKRELPKYKQLIDTQRVNEIDAYTFAYRNSEKIHLELIKKLKAIEAKEAKKAGLNVGEGLQNGLNAANDKVEKAARKTAKKLKTSVEGELEIKSPSRWAIRLMQFVGQGFNIGSNNINFNVLKQKVGDALKAVVKSVTDTKSQGGATLGVFISNALKAGSGSLLGGSEGFKAGNIPSMLGSILSGNVGGDFIAKAIPLLIPILGMRGLNLGDSIVKILNNNLAIKPGFLTDLLKSVTGLKLESTDLMGTAFNMMGVKGKGKNLTPSSEVINKKIQNNIGDIGLGGSVEDLFSNLGNSFVNAIFGKLGLSGLKADLIKNIINQKIKSASGLITGALSGVAGGSVSSILGAYAKGDVSGLTTKTGEFLKTAGIDLDPKKVAIAVGLILTTLTSLQKNFTEEGFNLGKSLAKGFSDSQKNWQNAGDDLKRSAKKSIGADSLVAITNDIVKRMKRGSVVSKDMFDEFFNQIGKTFKDRALKGVPGSEKQGIFGNILGFGASIATMFAPIATFATALTPLLIPMVPVLGALGGLAIMVGKHLGSLATAIKTVEPLQRKLNFLGDSKEGGKAELNYARNVSNKMNVPIIEGINGYAQLAIAAKGTKLEGDGVRELYEGISASLSSLGISGQDASLVLMAYTQILSKGKLSMEELRQQLGEKFPPAMGLFAKAMGVSVGEMNTLVSKGAVLSEDILPKVAKVLNKDYGKSASNVNNFTSALTRLGNVGFDIAVTLTNAFGGMFAMFTNVAAGALSIFRDSLETLLPVLSSLMIGVTAVTGVGLATILNTAPIAKFLATVNNLLVSGLGALMVNLAPYYLGIIADVADGWLGAQNDLMQNMSVGVTNMFVSLFTAIDNMSRSAFDTPLFTDYVGKVDSLAPMLQGTAKAFGGLFKIIPPGVVELGALVLMFEQVQVLAKMFIIPSLKSIGSTLKDLGGNFTGMLKSAFSGAGLKDLFANTFSMGNISKSVTSGIQAIKGALMGLMPIAAEAAIALGVILLAKSDFSNPISDAIGKMASEINGAMKSITSSVDDLSKKFGEAGKSAKEMADALPSKGMELNLGYALGMGGQSLKSDDVIKAKNSGDTSKIPWYISMLFSDNADAKRFNSKEVKKNKSEADKFGVGKYFTGEEGEITLAQTQLLNQFKDIDRNTKGLSAFTTTNNLTKETSGNLITGDIKKAVDQVEVLDSRLFKLGKDRTNLSLINTSEAREKISEIDKQIIGIEKERKVATKPLIAMFDDVQSWGTSIDELIKGIEASTNPPDIKRKLKDSLEPLKQSAKEASDIIIKNLPVKPLEDVYTKTISALRDVELAYEKFNVNNKITTFNEQERLYNSGASKGSLDQSLVVLGLQDLQKQQTAIQNVRLIKQRSLENLTSLPDSNKSDERKKEISDLRKSLKEDDERIADLGSTIAKSKRDIRQTLVDQTKQVADYYSNAVKEAITISAEFEKAQNTLRNLNVQNKLKEALIGAGDNVYTQFVDGLISSLQELSDITNTQITADQKKAEYLNQIDEIKIQGAELQRNLPGDIVPFESNVIIDFNNQLITVDGTVNTINSSVNKIEENLGNDLVEAIKKANTELDITNEKVGNITDQSKNFTNTLKDGFSGISSGISDVIGKTSDWLTSLSTGGGLIANLASGIQGLALNNTNGLATNGLQSASNVMSGNALDSSNNPFASLTNVLGGMFNPQSGESSSVRMMRTGQMDDKGLEKLALTVFDQAGKSIGSFAANSGVRSTQNMFGTGGTTKSGSLAPIEYGNYNIGSAVAGQGAGVGKTFIPINPTFNTERSSIGFHNDANRASAPGSAGCVVFENEAEFERFTQALKAGNAKKLIFDSKATTQRAIGKQLGSSNMVDNRQPKGARLSNNVVRGQNEGIFNQGGMSDTLIGLIKQKEGFHKKSYWDYGQESIGFGTKAKFKGESITVEEANLRLYQELKKAQSEVMNLVKVKISTNQLDALTSFQYNTGGLGKSTLLKKLNSGDTAGASSEFTKWVKADGRTLPGLVKRRNEEKDLFNDNLKGLNNTVIQGGFIQPNQMQGLISQAAGLNLNSAQKRYQTDTINSGLTTEQEQGKRLDFERNFDSRIRTLQRGLFDASTNRTNSTRSVTDLGNSNLMLVKSPEQQFNLDQENRTRQYDDKIRELQQKLNELKGNLGSSENAVQKAIADSTLKTLDPARYQSAVEGAKAAYSSVQADIKSYGADLESLEKQKTEALKLNSEHFNKTEYFRLAELSIQSETQKIGILQQQVDQYKQLQQVDPLNALVLKIPALERNLAVMNAEKDLRQEIITADKEYYNQQITQGQYEEKISFATKQNQLKKESIKLTLDEATVTAELNRKTLELEKTQFLQQSKMKGLQLDNDRISQASKNGIVDLKTLTNELTIKTNELTSAYERQRLELEKRNDLTPQEKLKENLRQSDNFRKETQLATNENAYKVKEAELVTNPQALMDNKFKRQDLLNKPGDEAKQLQIDIFRNKGGNEFVANKASRDLATKQEKFRYEKELEQLNIDVSKFNMENPNIAITTEELNTLTESVKSLHDANIQKIGMDFKSFGMSLNMIVSDSVKGLGASFTEIIKGTKSLNDALDGFFDQILSGVLQTGINSLLGGLMGGGGGFLGGLFHQGGVVPNYALGGIANAFTKEASESGRKPLLAVVHQGEMLIPADRMDQLNKAGITPESLLGINNYSNGGVVGSMRGSSVAQNVDQARGGNNGLEVKYQSTVINNQSYVTSEQFEEGVRKAAQVGAEGGFNKMQNKLSNSSSFRRSVGI